MTIEDFSQYTALILYELSDSMPIPVTFDKEEIFFI